MAETGRSLTILTQYYPPETGAPQARLSYLAQVLSSTGIHVDVLTAMPNYPSGKVFRGYGGLYHSQDIAGIPVRRAFIYPSKSARLVPRMTSYLSFTFSSAIVGMLALGRRDFLMTESPPLFLGMSGYLLSRRTGARWIFNVADPWPEAAHRIGIIKDGPALRAAYELEEFCYRKAWLVTCPSGESAARIEQRFPGVRTHELTHGTDPDLFHPDRATREARTLLGPGCVALFAGLHGLFQDLDVVLDAAHLLAKDLGIRIVLVGDGTEKQRLQERVQTERLANVSMLDTLPFGMMPALMSSCDIAVVTMSDKTSGMVPSKLFEALASARPVVLVASGEAASVVERGQCGIVVGHGDANGLAHAIRTLAESPKRRAELGARAREVVHAHYDRRKALRDFSRLLSEA
jgi:glycosyltransferase involved in cell wall biosynthesis